MISSLYLNCIQNQNHYYPSNTHISSTFSQAPHPAHPCWAGVALWGRRGMASYTRPAGGFFTDPQSSPWSFQY